MSLHMDDMSIAGAGALIYGIIREIIGAVITLAKGSREAEDKERQDYEARIKAYTEQVKEDYETAKKELKEALERLDAEINDRHNCEKLTTKLEGKIELLCRLYGHTEEKEHNDSSTE